MCASGFVCVHVCLHVNVFINVCVHVNMWICICVHVKCCTYVCVHVQVYMCLCACECVHVCLCTCECVHVCLCEYQCVHVCLSECECVHLFVWSEPQYDWDRPAEILCTLILVSMTVVLKRGGGWDIIMHILLCFLWVDLSVSAWSAVLSSCTHHIHICKYTHLRTGYFTVIITSLIWLLSTGHQQASPLRENEFKLTNNLVRRCVFIGFSISSFLLHFLLTEEVIDNLLLVFSWCRCKQDFIR